MMKVRKIHRLDPQTLSTIKQAGLLTADIELENAIREDLNLPERQEDEEESEPPKSDDDEENTEENDEHAHKHQQGIAFAHRQPNEIERMVGVEAMEMQLDNATASLMDTLTRIRDEQVQRIIDLLVAGRKIEDITVPSKKEMYETLMKAFRSQVKVGREQVREEVQRQRGSIQAQEMPDPRDLLDVIEEDLRIKVEGAASKLKTMVAEMYMELRKLGYAGSELRSQLVAQASENISDATWKALAQSSINAGWGFGRRTEIEKYEEDIEEVYRSGILDGNICSVCRAKDQVRHALNDPEYTAPDPACKGGEGRCRCINVAIMKAENAPEAG
jgi:hypothetical protein